VPALTGDALIQTRANVLVITCEHGGRDVPRTYAAVFAGHEALLASHRGWDAGALELARRMADVIGVPMYAATTTRLLVDLNRSIGHRQLFSHLTRALSPAMRQEIIDQYYRPHRDKVAAVIAEHIGAGRRVIHIASHSFTPVLDGVERRADVAWLYDPRRVGEASFVRAWIADVAPRAPDLRLRRNSPYRGRSDGLTAWLRKRHPDEDYLGIELELNQRIVLQGGERWDALQTALIDALAVTLADGQEVPAT
jgi:predicted N-formylglutamate amidohydrolase